MTHVYVIQDFREFYGRWAPSVLTYCQLFLGDRDVAEEATADTFFNYFSEVGKLFNGIKELPLDHLPLSLLRTAMRETRRRWSTLSPTATGGVELEDTLADLPITERSVFILRGALQLDVEQTAAATGFSKDDVHALWVRALLRVKEIWLDGPKNDGSSRMPIADAYLRSEGV